MSNEEDCVGCNEGMAAFLKKQEENIRQYGHSVVGTGTDGGVSMSYTVGLSDANFPEIIVFGLPPAVAVVLLNDAAKLLREGKLPFNTPVAEVANVPLVFKEVNKEIAAEYIFQANGRAQRNLPAIQMVLPDTKGLFPWDVGYDESMSQLQLTLYLVH